MELYLQRLVFRYYISTCFLYYYFHHTPFAWLCSLWFNLFGMLVFLISQPCLTRFQRNFFYLLLYAYSISLGIFRLQFLHNPTIEGTLQSRVKDLTTQNLAIICSSILREYLICDCLSNNLTCLHTN